MSDVVVISPDKLAAIVRQAVLDALGTLPGDATGGRQYLTEAQAAEYLGQKPNTLRNWRAQKRGPAYIKGAKSVLYARADLDAWLDAGRTLTTGAPHARHGMLC